MKDICIGTEELKFPEIPCKVKCTQYIDSIDIRSSLRCNLIEENSESINST